MTKLRFSRASTPDDLPHPAGISDSPRFPDGKRGAARRRAELTRGPALALVVIGAGILLLPQAAPTLFQRVSLDGTSGRAAWVHFMGGLLCAIGLWGWQRRRAPARPNRGTEGQKD